MNRLPPESPGPVSWVEEIARAMDTRRYSHVRKRDFFEGAERVVPRRFLELSFSAMREFIAQNRERTRTVGYVLEDPAHPDTKLILSLPTSYDAEGDYVEQALILTVNPSFPKLTASGFYLGRATAYFAGALDPNPIPEELPDITEALEELVKKVMGLEGGLQWGAQILPQRIVQQVPDIYDRFYHLCTD